MTRLAFVLATLWQLPKICCIVFISVRPAPVFLSPSLSLCVSPSAVAAALVAFSLAASWSIIINFHCNAISPGTVQLSGPDSCLTSFDAPLCYAVPLLPILHLPSPSSLPTASLFLLLFIQFQVPRAFINDESARFSTISPHAVPFPLLRTLLCLILFVPLPIFYYHFSSLSLSFALYHSDSASVLCCRRIIFLWPCVIYAPFAVVLAVPFIFSYTYCMVFIVRPFSI